MHQIVNAIQIQHDAGSARAATGQKKGTCVLEAERNQISDDLNHDLCPHEREYVMRFFGGFRAAPAVARAIRNETVKRRQGCRYERILIFVTREIDHATIPTRDSLPKKMDSRRDSVKAFHPLEKIMNMYFLRMTI